jgi:uncharacterized protein
VKLAIPFIAGLLFAVGLAIGGMTQPAKVVGFLDLFGDWDPSLAFVMGGALAVNLAVYRFTQAKRERPVLDETFHLPTNTQITARLIIGSALFGIGWGLSGFCPGPALASVVTGTAPVLVFVLFMGLGVYGHALTQRFLASSATAGGDG